MPWVTTSHEKVLTSICMLDQSNQFILGFQETFPGERAMKLIISGLKLGKRPPYNEKIVTG
jgi:hypothetical protein